MNQDFLKIKLIVLYLFDFFLTLFIIDKYSSSVLHEDRACLFTDLMDALSVAVMHTQDLIVDALAVSMGSFGKESLYFAVQGKLGLAFESL